MSLFSFLATHIPIKKKKKNGHETVERNVSSHKSLWEINQSCYLPDTKFNEALKINKWQPIRMFQLKEILHQAGADLTAYVKMTESVSLQTPERVTLLTPCENCCRRASSQIPFSKTFSD